MPAVQPKHAVCPLSFMNLPASQLLQLGRFDAGCTVPGLHAVGSDAPVEQKDPEGQTLQSPTLVITARSRSW